MKPGEVFFIKDSYWTDFGLEHILPCNKSPNNMRPCVFVFEDKDNSDIKWFVPVSSKVGKYSKIEKNKIRNAWVNGEAPVCPTIRFGRINGVKSALLVQNLFPITVEYIEKQYVDSYGVGVTLSYKSLKDLQRNAKTVINNVMYGNKTMTFTPIDVLKNSLEEDFGLVI